MSRAEFFLSHIVAGRPGRWQNDRRHDHDGDIEWYLNTQWLRIQRYGRASAWAPERHPRTVSGAFPLVRRISFHAPFKPQLSRGGRLTRRLVR